MTLTDFYNRQNFFPNLASLFLNPFYFARKGLLENIKILAPQMKGKLLDIGCGMKPYMELFQVSEHLGLEIDTPENRKNNHADFYYDGNVFPFSDQTFDCLLSSQVFEHVFEPDKFLSEANRVLKSGGYFLLTAPFLWDEHSQPFDYARYSSFGIKYLLNKHGFEIISQKKSVNDLRLLFQLLAAYFYKIIPRKILPLRIFLLIILITPINILGELLALITPKNDDLYLDNIILCRKK